MIYQMGDSLGGLLFIASGAAFMGIGMRFAYAAIKRQSLIRFAVMLVGVPIAYGIALIVSSALSADRIIPLGSTECFDDWCVRIVSAMQTGGQVAVNVEVENMAKRRAQAPDHPKLMILDQDGKEYAAVSAGARPITSRIEAGETFATVLQFLLPAGATAQRALITEGSGPPLIGDQNSFLHAKTYVDLSKKY